MERHCSPSGYIYLVWIVSGFSLVWWCRTETRFAVVPWLTRRESPPYADLDSGSACSCLRSAEPSTRESSSWRERRWFAVAWSSNCCWNEPKNGRPRDNEPECHEVKLRFRSSVCFERCSRFWRVGGVFEEFRGFAITRRERSWDF